MSVVSRSLPFALAAGALLAARSVSAQTDADRAAYYAAIMTPVGALPVVTSPAVAGETRSSVGFSALYGYVPLLPSLSVDGHAAGARLEATLAGRLSVAATGGYMFQVCPHSTFGLTEACNSFGIAGAEAQLRLIGYGVESDEERGTLTVSLSGRAGAAFPSHGTIYALEGTVPIAMVVPLTHVNFTPFIAPGFVRGHFKATQVTVTTDQFGGIVEDTTQLDQTGNRFVLSGGAAILGTRSGLGLHLTVTKVFIRGGDTQVGAAVSWNSLPFTESARR